MVQGEKVTNIEKEHIIANKDLKFPSQIAKEISGLYPMENGGHRGERTIKRIIKEFETTL